MTPYQKILIVIATLLVGVGVGRYSLPAKIVTEVETKIAEKEVIKWKEKRVTEKQNDKSVVIIETRLPDGTVRIEKHILDKGTVKIDSNKAGESSKDSTTDTKSSTTVEYSKRAWHLAALVSPSLTGPVPSLSYGLLVERRILGPFYLGAFGLTNKTVGFSLGMEL